jgi:hypothetical protein
VLHNFVAYARICGESFLIGPRPRARALVAQRFEVIRRAECVLTACNGPYVNLSLKSGALNATPNRVSEETRNLLGVRRSWFSIGPQATLMSEDVPGGCGFSCAVACGGGRRPIALGRSKRGDFAVSRPVFFLLRRASLSLVA